MYACCLYEACLYVWMYDGWGPVIRDGDHSLEQGPIFRTRSIIQGRAHYGVMYVVSLGTHEALCLHFKF